MVNMVSSTILLITILLVSPLILAYNSPSINRPLLASTSLFPKTGPLDSLTLKQWSLTYNASSYLPTCGFSNDTSPYGATYWSNSNECDLSMASFNSTTSFYQAAIYALSGEVLLTKEDVGKGSDGSDVVGKGDMRCLCMGVMHVKGRGMDVCLLVGPKSEIMERQADFGGNTAAGLQGPEGRDARKILPRCEELEEMKNGTTTDSNATSSNKEEKKPVLSTEAIIGFAIGLPGAIVAFITMFTLLRKQRRKKVEKYTDVETGAKQKRSWKFWERNRVAKGKVKNTSSANWPELTGTTPAMEMQAIEMDADSAQRRG